MRKLISRIVAAMWTICAALTITIAISISVIRLVLPHLEHQRGSLESWLSEVVQRPVKMGAINASWRGWAPQIDISDLALFEADGTTEIARFDYAAVDISPWASVSAQRLIPRRLVVGGVRVALERDHDGSISIAGMPPSRWPVLQWLLQQKNFTLRDADITLADARAGIGTIEFTNVSLTVSDGPDGQTIVGSWRRETQSDETYAFALGYSGDLLSADWSGDVYLNVGNAAATEILSLAGWDDNPLTDGILNAKIWSRWDAAKLQRTRIDFDASSLQFRLAGTQSLHSLNSRAMIARTADGWAIAIEDLTAIGANNRATIENAALRWIETQSVNSQVAFRAGDIDLAALLALAPRALLKKAPELEADLNAIAPHATLQSIRGIAEQSSETKRGFFVAASLHDWSSQEHHTIPSVKGLDIKLLANGYGGIADLTQNQAISISSERWFAEPLDLHNITGRLKWTKERDGWSVASESFEFKSETIDIVTRGSARWSKPGDMHLSLVAQIRSGEVDRLSRLLPQGVMGPRGDAWLRSAFLKGQFSPSSMVFRGQVSEFPFDKKTGTFLANFAVRDVDLNYSAKWPVASSVTANVVVDGRRAETKIEKGRIYSVPVAGSVIDMPNLFTAKPVVRVHGKTQVTPREMGKFIAQSPLKNTKAARYRDLAISGKFGLTLDLDLGLYPQGDKEILGLVHFSNNRITHEAQNITLEAVTGAISFTRQDWYGEDLRAVFRGDPVGVVLNGGLDDPNYDTEFRMTGTSSAAQLLSYLDQYAPLARSWVTDHDAQHAIDGRLPWKAVLTIPEPAPNGIPIPKRLTLESSLLGLGINLPWPLAKHQTEKKPLTIRTESYPNGARTTRIDFGSIVDAEIEQKKLTNGTMATHRAEIIFGDASPQFTAVKGVSIRGKIARLPLNEWAAFANRFNGSSVEFNEQQPANFDIEVADLNALARSFKNVKLAGERTDAGWQVNISSEQAIGSVHLPNRGKDGTIVATFERLYLESIESTPQQSNINPATFPPFKLTCDSLKFSDIDLGKTVVSTSRTESGLRLDRVSFLQPDFTVDGHGDWFYEGGAHQSRVQLSVRGDTLAGLLNNFNYDVANIEGGKTEIKIDANWRGMPSEFTLEELDGSFTLKVDEGRFLDIEPGSGRLFGLLSLQTLPRRLSLDFNDLFGKGLSFDSIEGAFELDRGNAYTNSLLMDGPSAKIDVSGRTGLSEKDYDQHVTVTPALSNAIPIAGALFGPAGIGVGAVLFLGQKMFKSIPDQVDKFLSREYSITGAWEQPIIEKI